MIGLKKILKSFKSWINRENKPGTPLWRALLLEHRLPWRYDPFKYLLQNEKGFKKLSLLKYFFSNYFYIKYLSLIKGCECLGIGNMFYSFYDKDKNEVIKAFNPRSYLGYKFYKKTKDPKEFENLVNYFNSLPNLNIFNNHMCRFIRLNKNRTYCNEYIEGYNLCSLNSMSIQNMDKDLRLKISSSINNLLLSLESYNNVYGGIHGDWVLPNLVYSAKYDKILMVDLLDFDSIRKIDDIKNQLTGLNTLLTAS